MKVRGFEEWIEVEVSARPSAAQVRALHWLENDGTLELERLDGTVRFPCSAWLAAGELPSDSASTEETDEWQRRHDEIGRLLGIRLQSVHVDVQGYLLGSQCKLALVADGTKVADDQRGPVLPSGVVLLPAVLKAHLDLQQWTSRPPRDGQVAAFGQLKAQLIEAADLLAGSNVSLQVTFHPHLQDVQVRSVKRAALSWKPASKGHGLFSLEVDELREGQSPTRLPVEKLSEKSPLISISSKEHLLLPPEIAAVARVARQNRNKKERNVERDPTRLLPAGHSYDSIDLSGYSDRVLGFETLQGIDQTPPPATGVAWYQKDRDASMRALTLRLSKPDGSTCERNATKEEALSMLPDARAALGTGGTIDLRGESFVADAALVEQLVHHSSDEGHDAELLPATEEPVALAGFMAAVILEHDRSSAIDPLAALASVPWSVLEGVLRPDLELQDHQRQGIAWLWSHYQARRAGVLLADEMGLGKTLQIGSFLALQTLAGHEDDQRRSTLIVCPKVLIANWQAEMERYFRPGTLPRTRELRNDWLRGGDADVLDVLQPAYFVLSYDAFARYQQELLKREWASAILDESQNIKNPDTYRARAARGLKRTFGICATGTPVENRLRDLWTQFDFLSPGVPFGPAQAFCSEYESVNEGTGRLRAALRYPSASSPVLHREKRDVLAALPEPKIEVHPLAMTPEQAAEEKHIVTNEKSALKILGSLQKLYQHPALLRDNQALSFEPQAAIDASPKLQKCIEILQRVRAAGEKALIFTLWTQMQELLADVVQHTFGFRPSAVNGASNQNGQSKKILQRFADGDGFGALIMSPLAAGAGLNVTAANHVIHYGRWWNPAKEDQATARAHRIGQTRNVHVHYLVLHDPDDPSLGFDRKLHDYVERKRQVASDFLAPTEGEELESVLAAICRRGAQL